MGIPGKGIINSLTRNTRRRQIKWAKTSINDVVPQNFMKLLEEFKDLPYLEYRKRQVKNEPNEAYLFLDKKIISCLITRSILYYVTN